MPLPPEETPRLPAQESAELPSAAASPGVATPSDEPLVLPATTRSKFIALLLNSTACYLVAYQVVNLVYQGMMVAKAQRARVPGTWEVSGVHFRLGENGWRHNTVVAVYGTGPLLVLVLGGLAFLLFWKWQRDRRGLGKLLLLWLSFHALNTVLGGLLADTITQSGLWYLPNWIVNVGTWPSSALGILLAIGQVMLGFALTVPFLLAQESRTILQFERRPQLVRYTIMGPWALSSFLLILSKLPQFGINEGLHYATMGLLLGPLALGVAQESMSRSKVTPRPTRVSWALVGLALLGLLAWRLALNVPVAFR